MSISVAYSSNKMNTYAQQGIFMTWQDYKANKITPVQKINLNHLYSGHYVDIILDGKKMRYCKDSIYGYQDEKGKNYRFYKAYNDEYQIMENGNIVIYMTFEPTHTPKGISQPRMPYFYFSTSLDSPILSLTALNLKNAYPDNLKFHDLLDMDFASGTPISLYDIQNKMYRVNYLLNKLLTK